MPTDGTSEVAPGTASGVTLHPFAGAPRCALGARLVHGAVERRGGVSTGAYAALNLGRSTGDAAEAVAENARRVVASLGAKGRLHVPRQVHGAAVVTLDGPVRGPLPEADALVTGAVGVAVGVLGADCPGVLVVDPVRRALAVVHAGWRGVVAGALPAAVAELARAFASAPADLFVGIGPGIGPRRYEVGPEVACALLAAVPDAREALTPGAGDRVHADLALVLVHQARGLGVPAVQVERLPGCTYDEPGRWFSHRRDGPATGRHALVAAWVG